MSSPPSSSASMGEADTKSSPDRAIAFLVHSPDSVANNLPPDCDNKPLARQRRRRTSPDDQRVLEEAFARNPRPSKEERLDIISKVALGDKEVQIWFQNRRQSSRRKSKPLDTSEMEARLSGSSSAPSSPIEKPVELEQAVEQELVQNDIIEAEEENVAVVEEKRVERIEEVVATEVRSVQEERVAEETVVAAAEEETQATSLTTSIDSSQAAPVSTFQTELNSSQSIPTSSQDIIFTSITKPTYLANRRSASFVRQHTEDAPIASQTSTTEDNRVPALRKSGSFLRLSMSSDGQARIIDRSLPSPPSPTTTNTITNPEPTTHNTLRRSYSAAGLNDLFKASTPQTSTKVPRVSQAGRSRDSRAWEFWCDADARSALANKAEQENSGSAADAIGLIRQSSKNALRPNSRKGNSPMVSQGGFGSGNGKSTKGKLQRAHTTYGRLQDSENNPNPKKGAEEANSPSGDSDKENWDPEPPTNAVPRRRSTANPRRHRAVLGENANIPSYATSLGGLMDSEKKRRAGPARLDAEVAAFMGGADESEDLDCVQSLLSLSKGNWR